MKPKTKTKGSNLKIIIHHHDKSIGHAISAMTRGILSELRIKKTEVKCNPRKKASLLKGSIPLVLIDSAICESIQYNNPETVKILLLKEKETRTNVDQFKRFNHILITPIERELLKQLIQEALSTEGKNG